MIAAMQFHVASTSAVLVKTINRSRIVHPMESKKGRKETAGVGGGVGHCVC